MSSKASIDDIEVIEVNRDNFHSIWPYLLISLKNADYIALDLELSGLGSRHLMNSKNVEERYSAIREAAISRSVLSLGLAFFQLVNINQTKRKLKYRVQVFNILTLCSQPFTIEPEALEFLIKHSFDFNRLISSGVHYNTSNIVKACYIRVLITEIFSSSVPLALHNGLIDLAFLYQHFYAPLPEKLSQFTNALSDLFPKDSPICDSKYLAEYVTRMKGSFLEYVFRKSQRENLKESIANKWYISIRYDNIQQLGDVIKNAHEKVNCSLPENFPNHLVPCDLSENVCTQFSNHGFCRAKKCEKSHDVDFALDLENEKQEKERKKRKRRYEHLNPDPKKGEEELIHTPTKITVVDLTNKTPLKVTGCHRAGIDAFMTGFSVLFQSRMHICRKGSLNPDDCNKIPLSGKDTPLIIQQSNFGGNCSKHEERFHCLASAKQRNLELKKDRSKHLTDFQESS